MISRDDVEGTVTIRIGDEKLTINALNDDQFQEILDAIRAINSVRDYHKYQGDIYMPGDVLYTRSVKQVAGE